MFTSNVLKRLEITGNVPKPAPRIEITNVPLAQPEAAAAHDKGIVTTDGELNAFEDIRRRLAYLSGGKPELYEAINKVQYRDFQGKMDVVYQQERKGRLLDIVEGKDGTIRFVLWDGGDATPVTSLAAVDERLKALFEKRVTDG